MAKVFSRWHISGYKSEFISNLRRLKEPSKRKEQEVIEGDKKGQKVPRYVDNNFVELLKGVRESGIYVDTPWIFIFWAYLEELGIYPVLNSLRLAYSDSGKGYSWFDHFSNRYRDTIRPF